MTTTKTCAFRKSDMTPCVIVDGDYCYAANLHDEPICVGCERKPKHTGVPAPASFASDLAAYKAKRKRA